jgi:MFS family permease
MRIPAAFDALKNREYRLLWLGAVASLTSAQMRQIANGYLAYELTGSAAVLALVVLGQSLPSFFLAMFGGVIADRVKRRQLLLLTQSCIFVDSTIMAFLVVTGLVEVWHIIALGIFHGSVLAFNQPSRQAYMVELAGSENVTQAIALYSSGQTAVRIIGPTIAGAFIGIPFIGIEGVFVAIAACYTLPVILLLMIRARPEGAPRVHRPIFTEFKAGFQYIRNHEVLRILVIVGIVPPLLGNHYQQFLPVFASEDVLNVGGSGLGLMATCTGIGAFLGAMTVASFARMPRRGLMQLGAGALFGLTLVFFGLSRDLPMALVSLVGVGFAFALFQTLNTTLTFASSDPEYYGRVSSVQQLNHSLGSFIIVPVGFLVDQLGAPTIVLVSGLLIFTFWCFVGLFMRSYRRIEMPRSPATDTILVKDPAPTSNH